MYVYFGDIVTSAEIAVALALIAFGLPKLWFGRVGREGSGIDQLMLRMPAVSTGLQWRSVGALELIIGLGLLAVPFIFAVFGALWFVGCLIALLVVRVKYPGRPCGCSRAPSTGVNPTSFVLPALLASLCVLIAAHHSWRMTSKDPGLVILMVGASLGLFYFTSTSRSITNALWRSRLNEVVSWWKLRSIDSTAILPEISGTPMWRQIAVLSTSEGVPPPSLVDSWREGSWLMQSFDIWWGGRPATLTAGIFLPGTGTKRIRMAISRPPLNVGDTREEVVVTTWDSDRADKTMQLAAAGA